jgi:hypothetical protein
MFPTNTVVTGASGSEIVAGLGGALKVASATTDAGAGADRGGGGSIPGSRGCGIVDCPTRNVFSIVFNPRPGMGRCPIGGTIPGNCPGMKLGIGIMDEGRGGMPGIIPEGGPLRSGGSPIRGIRGIPPSGGGGKAITNEIHYLPAAKSP